MRIATWNVNSVKAREQRVLGWLREHDPDVLCLQELKTTTENYPKESIREAGYRSAVHGQKTYNGVALVSKVKLIDVRAGQEGSGMGARLISGRLKDIVILSAYFPNGRTVGSDAFEGKLAWMNRLLETLRATWDARDPLVLAGDFNVAPDDLDVANPEKWSKSVLCHPAAREALERIREWGFVDVVRKHNPDEALYSWWDYRQLGFPRNDGLRIDHIFATPSVADMSLGAWVDRDQRKGKKTDKPSDHAPVVADFDL